MGAVGFAKRPDDGRRGYLMAGHGSKVGRKQEEAIAALLSQRNVEEAARLAGVGVRTLYRWMKEPAFDTAYREAKRAAFSQAIARLHQMSSAAVTGRIHCTIQVSPFARNPHMRLVHPPGSVRVSDLTAKPLIQNGSIVLDPAPNGDVVQGQAPFRHHFFQVAVETTIRRRRWPSGTVVMERSCSHRAI